MPELIHGTMAGHEGGCNIYSPWLDLAAAIVKTAADDYVRILRRLWRKTTDIRKKRTLIVEKTELEEFFHSGWYETLTDIDPDRLIYQCKMLAKEKELAAIERSNRKRVKQMIKDTE